VAKVDRVADSGTVPGLATATGKLAAGIRDPLRVGVSEPFCRVRVPGK
jgi:hypothetical protein